MEQIKFECRSVTPMFMYGADGSTPELRPASIKGILRFWWRAMHGDLGLEKLHELEGKIFGSTEGRSSFTVRVIEKLECGNFQYLPHKSKATKKAFSPNQNFQVIFNANDTEFIKNLFTIATTLGGFGQRSRRGFGSIQAKHDRPMATKENIELLIKTINEKFSYTHSDKKRGEEYPYIQDIEIGKNYANFETMLEVIGKASHDYNCDELGYAKGKERLASPIYVSAIEDNIGCKPIITTLTNTNLENFKKAIL